MKNSILIFAAFLMLILSCKKYKNDKFISAHSPEARLIKGDSAVWMCTAYQTYDSVKRNLPDNHFSVSFIKSTVGFSDLGNLYEISNTQKWELKNNKETLSFFGEREILKLTMKELELKDSLGNIYFFEKRNKESISKIDEGILNVPLFGVFPELCKLVAYNSCENSNSITTLNGWNPKGVLGKGIISSNSTYTFSRYFNKPGYITFWYNEYASSWSSYKAPIIKLNGINANDLTVIDSFKDEYSDTWRNVRIKIGSAGNKTISIAPLIDNQGSVSQAASIVDEIRFWQIH